MKYIKTPEDLFGLIVNSREAIVYGAGEVSQTVLRYLKYLHNAWAYEKVCCIAVKERLKNPFKYERKPVYEFTELIHFRETALVVVLTSVDKHRGIACDLRNFGFVNVVFLSDEALLKIRYSLQFNDRNGIKRLEQELVDVNNKISDIYYLISEQNEICDLHKSVFSNYRNCYRDKSVVIVGSGPSLQYYNPIDDAIHIGGNFVFRNNRIVLDYLFIQDQNIFRQNDSQLDEIKKAFHKIKTQIFIGKFSNGLSYKQIEYPEDFTLCDNVSRYYAGAYQDDIYQDICHHPLMDSNSVIFPAVHFALFTYPQRLYVVGCDTGTRGDHFYSKDSEYDFPTDKVKIGWLNIKKFAQHYYPKTEIISVNPVGLRGLFKDIYTEEYQP